PYPVVRESALLTSTIVVSNQGPSDVTRTIITDTPSTNVEFVSVSPTGAWQCGYTGGFVPSLEVVTCTIGAFPADTTDTITVVWEVNPHTAGLLPACDRAQIKSVSTTDPNLVNNLSLRCSAIQAASADLLVQKLALSSTVASGAEITYTIRVHNAGPSAVTATAITDTIDLHSPFQAVTSKEWTAPFQSCLATLSGGG